MSQTLKATPISQKGLGKLAELIELGGTPDKLINQGLCGRFHDLATLDMGGRPGISLFDSEGFALPFELTMMERHPIGSQAFLPMQQGEYLVIVAEDKDGHPDTPRAFIAGPGQGVNIGRNVWHGVLCPIDEPAVFAVVNLITDGPNLEEFWFDEPIVVERA